MFADYEHYGVSVLVMAYRKSGQADLSMAEKKVLRELRVTLDAEIEVVYGQEE